MSTDTKSTTDAQIATVQEIYAAFAQGDVPGILGRLAEDVRWEDWADNFAQRDGAAPEMEAKTGRDGVLEFFQLIGQWDVESFEVLSIMAGGNQVAVEIEIAARLPNGGRFRDEEMHLWTFDEDGKVTRLRHYTDTAKHIAAASGQDTTA